MTSRYTCNSSSLSPNYSRRLSMLYPGGLSISYGHGLSTEHDTRISRLQEQNGVTRFDYLGLDNIVKRKNVNGIELTYIEQTGDTLAGNDAGDQYVGLDRFGRIVDQRWRKTSDGSTVDRFQYGYDRNGNRLWRDNIVNSSFGELYYDGGYDKLNRLTVFKRGLLESDDGVAIDVDGGGTVNKEWSLDALGNWNSVSDESQNRTHNAQNQLTSVEGNTLTYDANGNMKTDETGQTLVYDAWNRLVSVTPPGGSATTYAYDAWAGGRMHQTAESPRLATARPPAGMSREKDYFARPLKPRLTVKRSISAPIALRKPMKHRSSTADSAFQVSTADALRSGDHRSPRASELSGGTGIHRRWNSTIAFMYGRCRKRRT